MVSCFEESGKKGKILLSEQVNQFPVFVVVAYFTSSILGRFDRVRPLGTVRCSQQQPVHTIFSR